MQYNLELLCSVKRLESPQQCVRIGHNPAMYQSRVYHNNVLMLGVAQQSNNVAYTSAK